MAKLQRKQVSDMNKIIDFLNRKLVIVLLIIISLVMTTGSFAYFAEYVEGSQTTSTPQGFQIGTALSSGTVNYTITHDYTTNGYLIPVMDIYYSSNNTMTLTFTITWDPNQIPSDGWGGAGPVELVDSYILDIYYRGRPADSYEYNLISNLITIYPSTSNPTSIDPSTGSATLSYIITVDNYMSNTERFYMRKSEVYLVFDLSIQSI